MSALYLTLLAVLLAGFGGRDQMTIAGLTVQQGRRPAVLMVGIVSSICTALVAAWAAATILDILPPPARLFFAASALGLAGLEALFLGPRRIPSEPTNSLGALAFVLLALQITDSARFVILGVGVGLASPWIAGWGGALAGACLMLFAWTNHSLMGTPMARVIRRVIGGVLLGASILIGLSAFGLL